MGCKDIKSMNQRHFKILNLYFRGMPVNKIAEHLEMSPRQISLIVNSPSFRHEISIKRAQTETFEDDVIKQDEDAVLKTLKDNTLNAVTKLCNHLDSPDDKTSMKASLEILDRTGYVKKEQQKQQATVAIIINNKDSAVIRETIGMLNHDESTDNVNESYDFPPVNSKPNNL